MATRVEEVGKLCLELAFDSIGKVFEEQGGMPDCVKSMGHVQGDGPDLMFDIEGFHPLLDEYKQHVQCGVSNLV